MWSRRSVDLRLIEVFRFDQAPFCSGLHGGSVGGEDRGLLQIRPTLGSSRCGSRRVMQRPLWRLSSA